ncbi:MAG: glycosyl transferase, group 1 family protein [Bacteroidetes bacterium]|nr:glycosyl transferase, group 1 family protein [Bacteroidota bacterium]
MAARFFGKRSIIVVGGVDVAREPGLNYGMFLNPWKSVLVRYALRSASRVLVVDETLRSEIKERIAGEGKNIRYVPTGYDTEFWTPKGGKRSEVLTVAVVLNERRVRLKGIDTLIEAARNLPRLQFKVVGVRPQAVQQLNPPRNMHFYEPVPRSDLLAHYRRAQVYCQPSRREGLPNTLCEAMLCECIPVATTVGGIPSAVGKTGFLVPPDDPLELTKAITLALKAPRQKGKQARKRIAANFPAEKREKALPGIINEFDI